jgi:hypothetical protein
MKQSMPGHLFEYAVIRVVPRVEREEFLNVGVVVYCARQRYLQTKITINKERLKAFAPDLDIEQIKEYLAAFEQICAGAPDSGPIGKLDAASRFRWLTATRSTLVQSSKIHPGLSSDLDGTLEKLHQSMVAG